MISPPCPPGNKAYYKQGGTITTEGCILQMLFEPFRPPPRRGHITNGHPRLISLVFALLLVPFRCPSRWGRVANAPPAPLWCFFGVLPDGGILQMLPLLPCCSHCSPFLAGCPPSRPLRCCLPCLSCAPCFVACLCNALSL